MSNPAPLKTKGKGKETTLAPAGKTNHPLSKDTPIPNPAQKTHKPPERLPRLTSSQVAQLKTLYLVKDWKPKEIADKLNIKTETVSRWIFRLGLTKQKEQIQERVEQKALTKATSLVESQLNRWEPQLAELGDDSLDIAREIAAAKGKGVARDLKDISTAFSNFSRSWAMAAGLKEQTGTASPAVNIFLGELQVAKPEPKPVQAEPIDVVTEAKPAT